ncbi:MAG: IS4 family transposase, partial [Planctomycetota bacterium]|nr:IS4 family transposase [Planctomycetota bacterium]
AAYHAHIQLGIIAQGLLQTLALRCTATVWKRFGSWLRTIRPEILPSEFVVAIALRHSLPLFLADSPDEHILVKFIRDRIDLSRHEGACLAAA